MELDPEPQDLVLEGPQWVKSASCLSQQQDVEAREDSAFWLSRFPMLGSPPWVPETPPLGLQCIPSLPKRVGVNATESTSKELKM